MTFRYYSVPQFIKTLFGRIVWTKKNNNNSVYLSFDDGPHVDTTEEILSILDEEKVKATFFLSGDNAIANPDLVNKIRSFDHSIGSHGMKHISGWGTSDEEYIYDVVKSAEILKTKLYRPPYGRMNLSQYYVLKKDFSIVMWSFLCPDYKGDKAVDEFTPYMLRRVKSGDIIVFHENDKSKDAVIANLKSIIRELKARGFTFDVL